MNMMILKYLCKSNGLRTDKAALNKNKDGGFTLVDIDYYQVIAIIMCGISTSI